MSEWMGFTDMKGILFVLKSWQLKNFVLWTMTAMNSNSFYSTSIEM